MLVVVKEVVEEVVGRRVGLEAGVVDPLVVAIAVDALCCVRGGCWSWSGDEC